MNQLFKHLDVKQQLRLRRFFMALGTYAIFIGLAVFCYTQGMLLMSITGLIYLISAALAVNAFFFWHIYTGLNKKLSDPSMTVAQILVATAFCMVGCYYFTDQIRGVMLLLYYIVLLFGIFKLKTRHFLSLTIIVLICYSLIIFLLLNFNPQRADLRVEILRLIVLGVNLFWFSLIGGYISRLRSKLARTNVELQEAMDKIENLAMLDDLTKVYNRRQMFRVLEKEKKRAARTKKNFSVCLADIDYFKQINDSYGHLVGDAVLKEFAAELGSELREIDFLARYGGEEFFILLPDTDLKKAKICAERLRKKIKNTSFSSLPKEIQIKASFGVTEYYFSEPIEATLARADKALYQAKKKGRDRVEVLERY